MPDSPIGRILRDSEMPDLLDVLAERLSPTDLQSLMLEVYRRRAEQISPAALLNSYERSRFVRPSAVSPVEQIELDALAFSLAAPWFEPIELAPVVPLGTNSVVAFVDQNKAVATSRNSEVVSDSTNVLALECALRRRTLLATNQRRERVRLCATHRLLRPQASKNPAMLAHFRLFALCTAGRDEGNYTFELTTLNEHICFYLLFLRELGMRNYDLRHIRVTVTDLTEGLRTDALHAHVVAPLAEAFPNVTIAFDPERSAGRTYYDSSCFAVYAQDQNSTEYMLADGGCTTWTQQLLSNQKERCVISGVGSERLGSLFRRSESFNGT